MTDLRGMSDAELAAAVERVRVKAARCSPPCSIVEAQLQTELLLKLAQIRDEQHRRDRLRGSPPADSTRRGTARTPAWLIRARQATD